MDTFYPFIHQPERKKKENEPIPLYIELVPQPEHPSQKEDEQEEKIIIIELL
jgi:hypothetical protein